MNTKSQLREHYRALRRAMPEALRFEMNLRILDHLSQELKKRAPHSVATYAAIGSEVDLQLLVQGFPQILWSYPKVKGDNIEFWAPVDNRLSKGAYGIPEPEEQSSQKLAPQEIEICLVPGLCFDRYGGRLGSGKGYYDRFLRLFSGETIGVGFATQLSVEPLPQEANDVSLHRLVTENGFITAKKR